MTSGKEDMPGIISVSDEMLDACIIESLKNIEGVVAVADGLVSNLLTSSHGVKVTRDGDKISIDIYLIAAYGSRIPQLAWDIQKKVKLDVESITREEVSAINIHIQGVAIQGEEDK